MKFHILCLLFFGFLISKTFGQISPGDLTNAHADLEGISNCTKCHVLGEQVSAAKCVNCHSEIKKLTDAGRGFHSSSDVKGKNCWSCHSEHHGRNFRIINFDKARFNHDKTGFILTGAHTKQECEDCHQSKFITDASLKKRKNTFLGLSQNCSTCHEDYHQKTLGTECSSCHNTEKFKPALKFNHDEAAFRLTGAHSSVQCLKCHSKETRGGKPFQKFKLVAFSSCINCHKDAHQGKFGTNCQQCHVTASFKQINQSAFDHNKTNFPLAGRHKTVSCTGCHKTDLNSKPKHEKCSDCHKDYHRGEFTRNEILTDCSVCHNEEGFKPSLFTIEKHNKSEFQLTGAHLAVPCQTCHLKQDQWQFRNIGKICIDCHKNVHGAEISSKFLPDNNCSSCHLTDNWTTINFEHNKTEFPLSGKHILANCNDCHYRESERTKKEFKFASLTSDCVNCHRDIHFGQFSADQGESGCIRCHTFNDWRPTKFDHNKTKFPLEGAHQKVKCSQCHKLKEVNGNQFIEFKIKDFKCAACHS